MFKYLYVLSVSVILFAWASSFASAQVSDNQPLNNKKGSQVADPTEARKKNNDLKAGKQPTGKTIDDVSRLEVESQAQRNKLNLAFVVEHHSELASLLEFLKQKQSSEFESAMRDIAKVRLRLETMEKRDPELYAMELEAWKIDSKIKLMLALSVAKKTALDRGELENLVRSQVENQMQRWQYEQARLLRRLNTLQDNLERVGPDPAATVEQQVNQILRKSQAKAGSTKRSSKPNDR